MRCAKKAGVGLEDLRQMVEKESAVTSSTERKGKRKAVQTTLVEPSKSAPQSYLEDVVEGAAPKKRKQRPPTTIPATVKPITDTRSSILNRAKVLLEPEVDSLEPSKGKEITVDGDIQFEDGEENRPPPTQQFATSYLADAFSRPQLTYDSGGMDEDLPATQAFQTSNLAAFREPQDRRESAFAYFDEYESPPTDHHLLRGPASIVSGLKVSY